jgi:Uma2 family endonuclease
MAMPAPRTEWTVDMLDAVPDDGQRYEIIDGELFVTPAPSELHQLIVGHLYFVLKQYLDGSSVGRALVSPADVRRGHRSRNRVQPDVFVVLLVDGKRPLYPYDLSDLLLAAEVPSPGNPAYDYPEKRGLYLRQGIDEYWIVNGEAWNVSRWRGAADPDEVLSERLEWHPAGTSSPLVVQLPSFFDDAVA